MVDIKFCGLTRAADAAMAAELGARYVGVVLASGPRRLEPHEAARVLDGARGAARRVGVFESADVAAVARGASAAALDIVQLHGDPSVELVARIRERTGCEVWAVVRMGGPGGADDALARVAALDAVADGVLLDTFATGRTGGTGRRFDWAAVPVTSRPAHALLIAAGGLDAGNVREAIAALAPNVVDVSSGVERAPGIKDHERMRAFAAALRGENGSS